MFSQMQAQDFHSSSKHSMLYGDADFTNITHTESGLTKDRE